MNSVGDGLMGAISALTAPPTSSGSGNGGKGGNKKGGGGGGGGSARAAPKEALCDGCGEGGDLILTCARCTLVSYHPLCDDPPLDEETLSKEFRWECRSCRLTEEEEAAERPREETEFQEGEEAVAEAETPGVEAEAAEPEVVNPLGESEDVETEAEKRDVKEEKAMAAKLRNLMKSAITSSKHVNPVPFELPKSFQTSVYHFPGTSRNAIKKGGGKVKSGIIELENYCVPSPVSVCFKCGKSCRMSALIQCDYCPKYFHFDCLTPPLTTPPVGLWICPLHPEPFLEEKMLQTTKLSERVALWDYTHKQVDRASVAIKFLTKCSRKAPSFSRKVPWPGFLKSDIDKDNRVMKFMDEKKLSRLFSFDGQHYHCYWNAMEEFKKLDASLAGFKEYDHIYSRIGTAKEKILYVEEDLDMGVEEEVKEREEMEATTEEVPMEVEAEEPNEPELPKEQEEEEQKPNVAEMDANIFFGIDLLLEAAEKLESESQQTKSNGLELVPASESALATVQSTHNRSLFTVSSLHAPLASLPPLIELMFVDQDKKVVIRMTQIFFGTEPSDDPGTLSINTAKLSSCPRLDPFHAILFYDAPRKQWEILNYSKHGLSVDGQRLILKPKPKKQAKINTMMAMKEEILQKRKILIEKQHPYLLETPNNEITCPCYEQEMGRCNHVIDNEGSAMVNVNSEIQIGCIRIVVSKIYGAKGINKTPKKENLGYPPSSSTKVRPD